MRPTLEDLLFGRVTPFAVYPGSAPSTDKGVDYSTGFELARQYVEALPHGKRILDMDMGVEFLTKRHFAPAGSQLPGFAEGAAAGYACALGVLGLKATGITTCPEFERGTSLSLYKFAAMIHPASKTPQRPIGWLYCRDLVARGPDTLEIWT